MGAMGSKSLKLEYGVMGLFTLLLLSPYGLLLTQVSQSLHSSPSLSPSPSLSFSLSLDLDNFTWALQNTVYQALGSAFFSMIAGVTGGMGLLWLKRVTSDGAYFFWEKLVLLPNMLPSLFVIVSCLAVIQPFPYGKIGIILIHTLINAGLVSVLFSHVCQQKLAGLGALSLVEGATRWAFFKTAVLGYLRADLFYLFLFVFAMSMVSFNVPLIVGGSSGTTLEVLIYENLVISQNWAEALSLSFIQVLIVAFLSFLKRPSLRAAAEKESSGALSGLLELVEWRWGLIIPLLSLGLVCLPPMWSIPRGLQQLAFLNIQMRDLLFPLLKSLGLGMGTGFVLLIFGLLACFGYEQKWWRGLMLFLLPPGAVIVGFAHLILGDWLGDWWSVPHTMSLVWGLALMFFFSLYRLVLVSPLAQQERWVEVAQTCGGTPRQILYPIVLPPLLRPLMFMVAMGSMWACGDFALSSIISTEDPHLAIIVKNLAGSYRLDAAQTILFGLYFVALFCFGFWWGVGHVLSRKFNR